MLLKDVAKNLGVSVPQPRHALSIQCNPFFETTSDTTMNSSSKCSAQILMALEGINQSYHIGDRVIPVLRNISLNLWQGTTCAILGASGSGKSTLLNILGLLDRPVSGRFHFAGQDMLTASVDELAAIRNREIGFVFQAFNLLPHLTALDNVALPLTYRGMSRHEARAHALGQMQRVGLAGHAAHRPAELSGGQCQRVAIARALIGDPSIILADEPTGNLDGTSAADVMDLLLTLNREQGVTLAVVTHDASVAKQLDRRVEVIDGGLHELSVPEAGRYE
ncbi:ABC transporter ATP-binding protein [Methylobacter sp. Wu8]|uniref:ABC transporter ATP-binding protein n=1 Tax=Methylobacter sp. Wu8 TaxID=3118457 RepID=UPI002F2DCDF8